MTTTIVDLSNAEIGERLALGPRNQTDLIRYAIRHGIVPMDD